MAKVKTKEKGIVVGFDEKREIIENGDSWVYADSLNIGEVLSQEHSEVLKGIRKVLKEYGLDVDDDVRGLKNLASESQSNTSVNEFVDKHTDFTYSICQYKDVQGKDRPYYKLSKDLLVLVMFSFSRLEKAKEFQLKYIAEFNRKEKELQWYRARYMGIDIRNSLTDRIRDLMDNPQWYDYANFTNLVYRSLYGVEAKEIRNTYGLDKKCNIRDLLTEECIKQVEERELEIGVLLSYGETYEQISKKVTKRYLGETNELFLNL